MKRRLLIVEDEAAILSALERFFVAEGYAVDAVAEPAQAEAFLLSGSYDVLITDLRLGDSHRTEGLDIVTVARERCPAAKIVVLTAYGSPDVEQEARRRGAHAFLHKPIPLADIAAELHLLLANP
jgi:two-component system, NtrC family, response regulator PilR